MICYYCKTENLKEEELYLFRKASAQWEVRCSRCAIDQATLPQPNTFAWLNQGNINNELPEVAHVINAIIDNADFLMLDEHLETVPPRKIEKNAKSPATAAAATAAAAPTPPAPNNRAHERHGVEMTIDYRARKQTTPKTALMVDLSKGGFGFIAEEPLMPKSVLAVSIKGSKSLAINFRGAAEVMRCTPQTDPGKFLIGARFIIKQADKKRKSDRQNVLFNLWYSHENETVVKEGTLVDISGGGLAMVVPEKIEREAVLKVCVRGDAGVFKDQEIRGLVRVVRSMCVYGDNHELGTVFIKTKVSAYAATNDDKIAEITL